MPLPCYKSCVEAPVAECLFLSTLAPAGCVWVELTSLTKSPPPYASQRLPSIKLANLQFCLSRIALLFFSGALDSLKLKCCVGFNPGHPSERRSWMSLSLWGVSWSARCGEGLGTPARVDGKRERDSEGGRRRAGGRKTAMSVCRKIVMTGQIVTHEQRRELQASLSLRAHCKVPCGKWPHQNLRPQSPSSGSF